MSSTAEINLYRNNSGSGGGGNRLKTPLAENTYEFLNKEFEFEFAVVRLSFVGSLVTLVKGLGSHLLLEYKGKDNDDKNLGFLKGSIVFTFMVSILTGLCSYMNNHGTMRPWSNWFTMELDLIKCIFDSFSLKKPLLVSSVLSLGLCFGLIAFYFLPSRTDDKDTTTNTSTTGATEKKSGKKVKRSDKKGEEEETKEENKLKEQ